MPRRRSLCALLLVVLATLALGGPAAAQYGGVSGLFVVTSPDTPGFADFNGLGCQGGDEVVLYMPGIAPTASDPVATQSVPGRILGVTTARSSADPLVDGTFLFDDIELPADLEPGPYRFHSRCGSLDLNVIVELTTDGGLIVRPPVDPPDSLPFTGSNSSRLVSLAAGLVTIGILLVAAGRRRTSSVPH